MISCPACQTPNPEGAKTCQECGFPIADSLATLPPPSAATSVTRATLGPPTTATVSMRGDAPSAASSTGILTAGQAFGTRYHVIRELGVGGMGAVYQAWDAELSVAVALKVIRPDMLGEARDAERRFKRELLLARQVTHKSVVRIHDLGEIDGVKYITMPYLEGMDLRQLLKQEGRLPVGRTVTIARQIASGLEAAHEVGVVHRDLKPANIMIEADDRALIMDFGIARSVSPDATAATMAGVVVGTLDYMAPEQARGEAVDHRADIYSFGLMVYDMLVGPRADGGSSPIAALMARMQKALPSPRSVDPQIPEALDRIVQKCLAIDPAERYQSTAQLVTELDAFASPTHHIAPIVLPRKVRAAWAAAAVAIAMLLIGVTWWVATESSGTGAAPAARDPVSILIADFENKTGDPVFEGSLEQALSLGVEGATFITTYSRQGALRLATQIGAGAKLTPDAARLVAVREGIKIVLSGEIGAQGEGYRIAVRAVDPSLDAAEAKPLAEADVVADDKSQVLQAVQGLAADVRRDLGDASLDSEAERRETFTAGSLEAAKAYAQAQDLAARGQEKDAIALYREALTRDPNMGRAYASWAVAAYRLGSRDEAEEQWKKALALMDRMTDRERYRTLGTYYFGVTRNYDLAVENYEALLQRYPADGAGLNNIGVAYFETLDFARAVEHGRRALGVYPKNTLSRQNLALYLMYSGDFEGAVKEAEQVIAANPAFYKAHLPGAVAALVAGNADAARQAYAKMAQAAPRGASLAVMGRADLAFHYGDLAEAERLLREDLSSAEGAAGNRDRALKQVLLADVLSAGGRLGPAMEAARAALKISDDDDVTVPAAQVLMAGGQVREAEAIASSMDGKLQKRTRALAKMIRAEITASRGQTAQAVDLLNEAKALADLWPVRFTMGRILAEAGQYADALGELDACLKRKGEAAAIYLTDVPSYRVTGPLSYWLARAQDGLGMTAAAAENYKAYLALREKAPGDRLAADARKRLGT